MNPKVLSVQIGIVQSYGNKNLKEFQTKFWETAGFKQPIETPVYRVQIKI